MKKAIGLALVPVLLASLPLMAMAEKQGRHQQPMKITSQKEIEASGKQAPQNTMPMETRKMEAGHRLTTAMDPRVQELWMNGQWNLVTRHYPEAIEAFQKILAAEPNNVHALDGLALCLYSQGRYDEALQYSNKAIALDPVNARLFYTKGQILDVQDMPREALEAYLTFVALNPDDGAALIASRRADELIKRVDGQLNGAAKNYYKGLQLLSLHQPQQAIEQFERLSKQEPDDVNAHILLGRSYLEMGQPERAIPHFESAIRAQVNSPVAYYHLGSSYHMAGQSQDAKIAWDKFVQYAPNSEAAALIIRQQIEVRH